MTAVAGLKHDAVAESRIRLSVGLSNLIITAGQANGSLLAATTECEPEPRVDGFSGTRVKSLNRTSASSHCMIGRHAARQLGRAGPRRAPCQAVGGRAQGFKPFSLLAASASSVAAGVRAGSRQW
ncbi:hypothetical protein GCM10027615_10310 [Plantactinospora veratri]